MDGFILLDAPILGPTSLGDIAPSLASPLAAKQCPPITCDHTTLATCLCSSVQVFLQCSQLRERPRGDRHKEDVYPAEGGHWQELGLKKKGRVTSTRGHTMDMTNNMQLCHHKLPTLNR